MISILKRGDIIKDITYKEMKEELIRSLYDSYAIATEMSNYKEIARSDITRSQFTKDICDNIKDIIQLVINKYNGKEVTYE